MTTPVVTQYSYMTDDELIHMASYLPSPLVRELVERLDDALGEVPAAITDDTWAKVDAMLGVSHEDVGNIDSILNALCKVKPEIKCPGCLHEFSIELDIAK